MLAVPLPASWYAAMTSMSTFICRLCKWVYAADPGIAAWHNLAILDISWNPLNAQDNSSNPYMWSTGGLTTELPSQWQDLDLFSLKVWVQLPRRLVLQYVYTAFSRVWSGLGEQPHCSGPAAV